MKKNGSMVLWVTRTAILTALLIAAQAATAPLGITLLTGSLVNLILIISVMTCGLSSGLTIAVISPFFAKMFGIGPALWPIIPCIALGNTALVFLWHLIGKRSAANKFIPQISALVIAAAAKFLVLYLTVVRLVIPFILNLPENKAAALSATFSFSQLVTAAAGGVLAVLILPLLNKSISKQFQHKKIKP